MAADLDAVIRALDDVGVDFSIPRESLLDFLANAEFTPYPAVAAALLKLLERRALRLPVFIDVIVFNYEHSSGNPSPRRIDDVDFAVLEAAVIEGFNVRHGEQNTSFESLLKPLDQGDQSPEPTKPSAPLVLDSAARYVLKGTLVPLQVAPATGEPNGPAVDAERPASGGLTKLVAIRQFALSPGDTDEVRTRMQPADPDDHMHGEVVSEKTLDALSGLEQPPVPSLQPDVAVMATLPTAELAAFANVLVELRAEHLARNPDIHAAVLLNTAVIAARELDRTPVLPVGLLNLERIEMVPAGIQRGELISTVPLAPGEETAVTHKEWSVTSKEFTTIVTDSLESVSETGVTDNTDLSQAATSENQHSNQFNITGTVQGGIPIISGSSTTNFTAQDAHSKSATESIKHARTTTEKASSRARQEHKVTISTKTETGSSETSTRILKNPSQQPIRIDYFAMMRKWRVRLYRYGLRLTYDLVIPEPGAAMRRSYAELEQLRGQLGPFEFPVRHSDIAIDLVDSNGQPSPTGVPKYQWLADQYGVTVPPYPSDPAPVGASAHVSTNGGWWFLDLEFDVPSGTRIREVLLDTQIGKQDGDDNHLNFDVIGTAPQPAWNNLGGPLIIRSHKLLAPANAPFLEHEVGHQKVTCFFHHSEQVFVGLTANVELTRETIERWQDEVWNALFGAAQTKYFAQQQEIAGRIAETEARLANVDTLTLRREEGDEIMKSVLRFILGANFEFMPDDVLNAFKDANVDLQHGIGFDGSKLGLSQEQWTLMRQHEDLVKFINEAIEWENVVSFLYSYFWDVPPSWGFVRDLRHPDPNRQAFLRAGAARVVLTVRKGWEERWMRFAEGGSIDAAIPAPYLSIAQEIAAYDDRNYPGIPPANPGKSASRLEDAVFTTSTAKLMASPSPVTIKVADSAGFVAGLPVVLDSDDDRRLQESVRIIEIPSGTEIAVENLSFDHDGTATPIAVLQPGEKGALIAEWNEYTPTSGTDIAITSNLATIA
ncbi:hypothetical protein GCM10023094_50030 [Rhodococcus olei]|uniref:Uncharacterized protein n=1 Tax=Rhodococcus olei TaxID=2161675 RepID=A0ABP8PMS0_9NOCA